MRLLIFIVTMAVEVCAQISLDDVRKEISSEAKKYFFAKGIDSVVVEFRTSAALLPKGEWNTFSVERKFLKGKNSIVVKLLQNETSTQRIVIPVTIRTFETVLRASKRIEKHQQLSNELLYTEIAETTTLTNSASRINNIEQFRSTRLINEGTMITESHIQLIPPVQQNQKITVMTQIANIIVSTSGRAISDGYFGEKIIVQPEGTHERILATVIAKGLVEVE